MEQLTPPSKNNPTKKSKKLQTVLGICTALLLTPLVIYTNCGQIPEQELGSTENENQDDFIQTDNSTDFDSTNQLTSEPVYKKCTNWVQEAYLKAPNANAGDQFGYVSISGDRIIVGASEDSNQTSITNGPTASANNSAANSGAAYVFARVNGLWQQEAYLKASNANANDIFGMHSTSISGLRIVIGASNEASNQTTVTNGPGASNNNSLLHSGAAYVFARVNGLWQQEAYLKAPNANYGDMFGCSTAIFKDRIIVGACGESSNQSTVTNGPTASADNSLSLSGAAYIFVRANGLWQQEAYLKAPNVDFGDAFGHHVSIYDNKAVIGAPWESSNQTTITNGPTASLDNNSQFSGAAYVFARVNGLWQQEAYLKASNAGVEDTFVGNSIFDNKILIGASSESSNQTTVTNGPGASNDNSLLHSGAAYVFTRVNGIWQQEAYLKAPNANESDHFGLNVSLYGKRAVIGATGESSNQTTITNGAGASANNSMVSSGAAYVFVQYNGLWQQEAYLKASNTNSLDQFGESVSIWGNRIVVGARQEDSAQTTVTNGATSSANNSLANSGAAYVYWCKGGII